MTVKQDLRSLLAGARFVEDQDGEETFHQDELVQLFPFGVSFGADSQRPFLLLKDASHEHTLPVAINALEAGVTLTQSNPLAVPASPHRFTGELMKSLAIEARQCVFVQIKGANQFVRVYLSGHPSVSSIRLRADEAMSLCLHLNIPIFASKAFIGRSKVLSAEIEGLGREMKRLSPPSERSRGYLM